MRHRGLIAPVFASPAPAPAPSVASVTPDIGDVAGGGRLRTITGANFTGATSVEFDGVAATSITVVDDETITCLVPEGDAGLADVTVTTPGGADTLTDGYEYYAPPTANQTLRLTAASGVVAAPAPSVALWMDQSGNSRHFSPPGAAPTYSATSFNGRPGVTFASGQCLTSSAMFLDIADTDKFTVYGAFKVTGNTTDEDENSWENAAIYSESVGDWGLHVKGGVFDEEEGTVSPLTLRAYHFGATEKADANVSITEGASYVSTHALDGSNLYLRTNLGEPTLEAAENVADTGTLVLGASYDGLAGFDGIIAEVIAYDVAHDGTTKTKVARYLMAEWGVS